MAREKILHANAHLSTACGGPPSLAEAIAAKEGFVALLAATNTEDYRGSEN
jgi:hypothetical protein